MNIKVKKGESVKEGGVVVMYMFFCFLVLPQLFR